MMLESGQGIRMLGIAGSLRRDSYNRALLRATVDLAPAGMTIDIFDLREIPLYNFDVERVGDPVPVTAFKDAIGAVDGLLFATPEYQHGTPGVLKNALDWASRPAQNSPMRGKTAAIIGASPGITGTARAQEQLRQTLTFSGVYVIPEPEVLVGSVEDKVDAAGTFVDESAKPFIARLLRNLMTLSIALRVAKTMELTPVTSKADQGLVNAVRGG